MFPSRSKPIEQAHVGTRTRWKNSTGEATRKIANAAMNPAINRQERRVSLSRHRVSVHVPAPSTTADFGFCGASASERGQSCNPDVQPRRHATSAFAASIKARM
jgi:hypothetical protein